MTHAHRLTDYILAAYVLILAAGFGFSGSAFSQVESASGADAGPGSGQPAEFRGSRFEIRDEYEDLQGGGTVYMIVPRVDFSANPDLSFRIETPIVFHDPGTPNNGTESGMGDLLFRGSYRVARGAGYAIVAGRELILNTATKDALGTGKNVIAPLIYASIDLPQYNSVAFPFLQHYVTLGGDDTRPDVMLEKRERHGVVLRQIDGSVDERRDHVFPRTQRIFRRRIQDEFAAGHDRVARTARYAITAPEQEVTHAGLGAVVRRAGIVENNWRFDT